MAIQQEERFRAMTGGGNGNGAETLARALGWFSVGLGVAEIVTPRRLGRWIGARDGAGVMRAMGVREVTAGIGILANRRPAGWMWARVAGDVLDLALLGGALAGGSNRKRAVAAAAAVAGVTALDVICTRQLSAGALSAGPVHVLHSLAVNKTPEECYRFWRDFANLPRFMKHLESVQETGDRRSHWIATGPGGIRLEWDAELTQDVPGERVGWRSVEGADIDNAGSIRFEHAPGSRGTVMRASIHYRPPAGRAGASIAELFGGIPAQMIKEDLRRFKQVIETGEAATTEGQPSGPRSALDRAKSALLQEDQTRELEFARE